MKRVGTWVCTTLPRNALAHLLQSPKHTLLRATPLPRPSSPSLLLFAWITFCCTHPSCPPAVQVPTLLSDFSTRPHPPSNVNLKEISFEMLTKRPEGEALTPYPLSIADPNRRRYTLYSQEKKPTLLLQQGGRKIFCLPRDKLNQ